MYLQEVCSLAKERKLCRKRFLLASTAADIVADPAAPDAFVEGIMESKEWVWDNGVLIEKDIDAWKSEIQKLKTHAIAERKQKVFKSFLESFFNCINIY